MHTSKHFISALALLICTTMFAQNKTNLNFNKIDQRVDKSEIKVSSDFEIQVHHVIIKAKDAGTNEVTRINFDIRSIAGGQVFIFNQNHQLVASGWINPGLNDVNLICKPGEYLISSSDTKKDLKILAH
jgi:tRNA U34 2-thiouridine synthase MnmA/TrmU